MLYRSDIYEWYIGVVYTSGICGCYIGVLYMIVIYECYIVYSVVQYIICCSIECHIGVLY